MNRFLIIFIIISLLNADIADLYDYLVHSFEKDPNKSIYVEGVGFAYQRQTVGGYVRDGDQINYFNNPAAETDQDENNQTGNLGLQDASNPFLWIRIAHKLDNKNIPFVKLQYSAYDASGYSQQVVGHIDVLGLRIDSQLHDVTTHQTVDSFEGTLYWHYKPLYTDLVVGVGVDYWLGKTRIDGKDDDNNSIRIELDWSAVLPYIYGAIVGNSFDNGISGLVEFKWADSGTAHHYEFNGALRYNLDRLSYMEDMNNSFKSYISVGYRYKEAYEEDGNKTTLIQYSGPYIEAVFKF